ncbi:hypothetical protein [Microcoleus sp. D2_18a_B4]|uniref:hypothetical protein n=1 Tax=Microcoleus sp. D2_18a_B4 TaxID=3055329 RepID=UPI002FD20F1A
MSIELPEGEKMLVSLDDVRFISWNPDKGRLLEKARGKKSRRQLAEEIKDLGGSCSHQNIKNLEYGMSEMVSVEVLQSVCSALNIHMAKFVEIYCVVKIVPGNNSAN